VRGPSHLLGQWPTVGVAVVSCLLVIVVLCRALYALRHPSVHPATFADARHHLWQSLSRQLLVRRACEGLEGLKDGLKEPHLVSPEPKPWLRYSLAASRALLHLLRHLLVHLVVPCLELLAKGVVPALAFVLLFDGLLWMGYAFPTSAALYKTTQDTTKPLIALVNSSAGQQVFGVYGLLGAIEGSDDYMEMLDDYYACMSAPCAPGVSGNSLSAATGGLQQQQRMAQDLVECAASLAGVDLENVCVPGSAFTSSEVEALARQALALTNQGGQTPSCALLTCVYTGPMCTLETLVTSWDNPTVSLENVCYMSASSAMFFSMVGGLIVSGDGPLNYHGPRLMGFCSEAKEAVDVIAPYCNGDFPANASATEVEAAFEESYNFIAHMLPPFAEGAFYFHLAMTRWWPFHADGFSWSVPWKPPSPAYYGFGNNLVLLQDNLLELSAESSTLAHGKLLQIVGALFALYSINASASLVRERMLLDGAHCSR